MALGTILGSLATSALTAGASSLAGKLLGGSKGGSLQQIQASPVGIDAGGLTGANGTIAPTAERLGLVNNVRNQFTQQAGEIGALRSMFTPGSSALRAARLNEIDNARTSAVSNLRDNLARRRVLGSSFGSDALARADQEFAQARDKVTAESYLQELEAQQQLINQQYQLQRSSFQTGLDELNLEADVATKLATAASTQMASNAKANAELALGGAKLDAESAAGAGKFFGQTFSPAFNDIGKSISSFFKAA